MEIRIGILNSRELSFETDASATEVQQQVLTALDQNANHVVLKDAKGSSYIIPTANIGYVELGSDQSRRVGFVA